MKKGVGSRRKSILLTIVAILFVLFIILPISLSVLSPTNFGNVALIPIEGVITTNGASSFGQSGVSSKDIIGFIKQADKSINVKVIVLEINSPGGTPVGSDEIAQAVKNVNKPVVSLIKDVGASGGYWIASSTDYIFANRMSITGSIGVISSYLEFSELMQDYGVGYERLVSGENKDLGSPFRKLNENQKSLMQSKIDKLHTFFVQEVSDNRNLEFIQVSKLATGEIFLGSEALNLGLVDQLGNLDDVETYLMNTFNLEKVTFQTYVKEVGFFEALTSVSSKFSFDIGQGLGSMLLKRDNNLFII